MNWGVIMSIKSLFDDILEFLRLKEIIPQKRTELTELQIDIAYAENELEKIKQNIEKIKSERNNEVQKTQQKIENKINQYKDAIDSCTRKLSETQDLLNNTLDKYNKQNEKIEQQKGTLKIIRSLQKELSTILDAYSNTDVVLPQLSSSNEININSIISPSLELPLHSYDIKILKALSRENNKLIEKTLSKYESRYTTKTNKAIYSLMVIALRAELQNILIGLKYTTLDKCKNSFNIMIDKYLKIASDGSQIIAPTLHTFIAEIRILFEKSIDIEYEYYVKKEQERAEQQALKEQMRQEMEERKELERQQKLVEQEEAKFKTEIEHAQEQLNYCKDNELLMQLQEKIKQLQEQLESVETKKEEIINLQNGKAGYVYIISNLGSFGDNRFKIGMTRRTNPIDRINELGSASVPFKFDVHSFIFSDDAVGLEHSLHTSLSDRRTNKINMRKEFFDISIDELETLVQKLDPTAEFNRTMLATEYRQSLALQNEDKTEENAS